MNPIIVVSIIALVLSIFNSLVTKMVTNEEKLEEARKRMSENQKKIKHLSPGSSEYKQIQDQIIKDSLYVTKESYKPLLYTTVVFIIVLMWLSHTYSYSPISVGSEIFLKVDGNVHVNSTCLGINSSAPISGYYKVNSENCSMFVGNNKIDIPIGSKKEVSKNFGNVNVAIKPPKMVFLKLPFSIPYVGNKIGYLGFYIIVSLVFGSITNFAFKKIKIRKSR